MADEILKRDENRITVLGAITDDASEDIVMLRVDPTTKRLLISATGGGGGGTIDSINNDSTAAQILQVGSSGSDFNIDDAGSGVHTFNIPDASQANRGLVTTGAQAFGGVKTFADLPLLPATVPTLSTQAVSKGYIDTFAQGLTVKTSCIVATTANILLSGEQTIDGVLTSTSRVLVKNQSTGAENGIYVSAAGAWARATDYDQSAEVQAGTFTAVLQGTTQGGTLWVQITQNPTIGSSTLEFSQLSPIVTGTGTVTSVSVVTANGISGTVATSTTTPAITLNISALDASKIANGTVSNTEFQYLDGVTSAIQTQIDAKAPIATPTFTGVSTFSSIVATSSIRSNTSLILEETGAGTDIITIQAPSSITASYTLTLPDTDGASGQLLATDGSGVLSWTNSSGFSGSFNGAQALTGVSYPRVFGSNLATGDTDLYTCPTGKRALILTSVRSYNPSAGSITVYGQLKSGGSYYRLGASTTLTTLTGGTSGAPTQSIVLEAGESFSLNTTTTSGLNISVPVIEFDSTCPLYSPRVLTLSNGNNTVYTVPVGKYAIGLMNTVISGTSNFIAYTNSTGGALDYFYYNVPNGGSAGSTNVMSVAASLGNNGAFSSSVGGGLSAGDFIVLNTSAGTAGQTAWMTVYEQTA